MKESPLDIVKKLDEAFNRKDIAAVLEFYTDDAIVVVEPGKLASGKTELKKFFEFVFKFDGIAQQDQIKVLEVSDIALFISKWHLTSKSPDGNTLITKNFIATSVFRKDTNGKWRLVIDNSFGPDILDK